MGAPLASPLVGPELYQRAFVRENGAPVTANAPLAPGDTAYSSLVRLVSSHSGIYSDGGSGNEPPPPPPPPPRMDVLGVRVGRVLADELDGRAPGSTRPAPPGSVQVAVRDGKQWAYGDRVYDDDALDWPLLRPARSVAWPPGKAPALSTGSQGWLWLADQQSATLSLVDPASGAVASKVDLRVYAGPVAGYLHVFVASDVTIDGSELLAVAGARLTHFDLATGFSTIEQVIGGVTTFGGVARSHSGLLAIGDGSVGAIALQGARFNAWYRLDASEQASHLGRMAGYLTTTDPSSGRVMLREGLTGELVASYPMGAAADAPCGADASGSYLFVDDCGGGATVIFDMLQRQ